MRCREMLHSNLAMPCNDCPAPCIIVRKLGLDGTEWVKLMHAKPYDNMHQNSGNEP